VSDETCTCGHCRDEHGHDPAYPGSTACWVVDCPCIAFEADEAEPSPEGGDHE